MTPQIQPSWNSTILVTFWVLQTLLALAIIGLTAFGAIMLSQQSSSSQSTDPGVRRGLSPNDVYVLVISCIAVIINITEAVLYKKRQLKPSRYLATNIIKTAPWAAILIIDIVAAALSNNISYGRLAVAISLIIIVAIFLLFLGSLIYASVIFHRSRKARLGKYHSPEAAVGIQASLSDEIHK